MTHIINKLRSGRGETLTEMLVSIVILGLSVSLMVTMIITSTRMTEQASDKDREYKDYLSTAEKQEGEGVAGTVTIQKGSDPPVEIDVKIYGDELKSYKKPD